MFFKSTNFVYKLFYSLQPDMHLAFFDGLIIIYHVLYAALLYLLGCLYLLFKKIQISKDFSSFSIFKVLVKYHNLFKFYIEILNPVIPHLPFLTELLISVSVITFLEEIH